MSGDEHLSPSQQALKALKQLPDGSWAIADEYRVDERDGKRWAEIEFRRVTGITTNFNDVYRLYEEQVPKGLHPAQRYAWIQGFRDRMEELLGTLPANPDGT